ncbi:hypothetical protein, partial [Salmonella sp. s54925]|uniref:hypothetical protein n=1 Tax=Salmonella sp. s54925 TaxID=3159674 RepID=UPI00397FA01A
EGRNDYDGYDGSKYTFDRAPDVSNTRKDHEGDSRQGDSKESEPEDFPRRVFIDNNPDYPEKQRSYSKKPRYTNPPSTDKKRLPKPTDKNRGMNENTKYREK